MITLQGVNLLDTTKTGNEFGYTSPKQQQKETYRRQIASTFAQQSGQYGVAYSDGTLSNNYSLNSGSASGSADGSSGGVGSDGSSSDGSSSNYVKSSMSKSERQKLYKMKDSNVPYYYEKDEDDLMYIAASEKRDNYWGLKEEMFLYTIHDRKKHYYITDIQIDADAQDIVTTCTIHMPYRPELIDYYIPGKLAFMIIGGTFDREVLFIGRVSETNQIGDSIEVVGQNIGWKFKQYMSTKFFEKIQGLPVPLVIKAIFKELGFTEGKYHMDLWAIPNVFKYKLDENGGVIYKGESVQNVPELTEVVKRMKKANINQYVATRAKLRETQDVADDYNKHVELTTLNSVVDASNKYYPTFYRKNYGIKTTLEKKGISYDPLEDRLYGTNKDSEYFTKDKSGDGEHTYEDILQNIASAIDAQFFIIDTTVCFVSFNALMAMGSSEAVAKSIQPRIEFWQMQEDSYELDINQYGYYNTVVIKYKNGTLERSYEDLVRVYGRIAVTYEEKDLNREAAQLKAQAHLSAHIRDFGMEVKATILYTGKINVSNFVKIQNPLTMSESLFYVYGTSIQWDSSNQTLICDLDLRYGPENPDDLEVPEYGLGYSKAATTTSTVSGNVSPNVAEAARQIVGNLTDPTAKGAAIYNWVDQHVVYECYTAGEKGYTCSDVLRNKRANCYDTAYLIYNLCTAVGVKCEVHNGPFLFYYSGTIGHLWNKIEQNGRMVFADTGRTPKNPLGQMNGKILGDTCIAKNY